VYAVIQEMQGRFRVMLGIQRNIEAGLLQRQAKEFALTGAVFDQEDGGVGRHRQDVSAGSVPGAKMKSSMIEWCGRTVS